MESMVANKDRMVAGRELCMQSLEIINYERLHSCGGKYIMGPADWSENKAQRRRAIQTVLTTGEAYKPLAEKYHA